MSKHHSDSVTNKLNDALKRRGLFLDKKACGLNVKFQKKNKAVRIACSARQLERDNDNGE